MGSGMGAHLVRPYDGPLRTIECPYKLAAHMDVHVVVPMRRTHESGSHPTLSAMNLPVVKQETHRLRVS